MQPTRLLRLILLLIVLFLIGLSTARLPLEGALPLALTPTTEPVPTSTPTPVVIINLYVPIIGKPVAAEDAQLCPIPGCLVDGLDHPKGIAVHTGLNQLYINSRETSQLIVLNARTMNPVATVETGAEPWDVVINENTNRVYVSNFASADVWVYDAVSLALLAKIRTGGKPALMDILPDLDMVAVSVRDSNGVALIEGLSLHALMGSGGVGPYGIAADPVSQDFVVVNRDTGKGRMLYRQDGAWEISTEEIAIGSDGDRLIPFEAEFNPVNQKLYIIYMKSSGLWYVDIFHKDSSLAPTKLASVQVGSSGSDRSGSVGGTGLKINPITGNLFVTNTFDNTLSVISGQTDQVVATVPTGEDPFEVTVNPLTEQVFVSLRRVNRIHKFSDVY